MKFRSEYFPDKAPFSISPALPVVLVGSCFSQNIAKKMSEHLWEAVNPCGTLYNPLSIGMALNMMLDGESGIESFRKSLFQADKIWASHFFDSSFSSLNKDDSVKEFTIRQSIFRKKLNQGRILIVTFGTSICYFLNSNEMPVGNCHKQPPSLFCRKRLSVSDITEYWSLLISRLKKEFPGVKIIFTVSPVRHLKDGFSGNSRSKAVLLLAVEEICAKNKDCFYFPALEIVNDDLRDYRFYASDLAHPSEEAIEYVWQKFIDTFIDNAGIERLLQSAKAYKASTHRPKTGALGKLLSQ